jgi:hypothetical protein
MNQKVGRLKERHRSVEEALELERSVLSNDTSLKTYEIWVEGYACTGQSATASLVGSSEGRTFREACLAYAVSKKHEDGFINYFNPVDCSYWGCRWFDNETDARKSFG